MLFNNTAEQYSLKDSVLLEAHILSLVICDVCALVTLHRGVPDVRLRQHLNKILQQSAHTQSIAMQQEGVQHLHI